MVDGASAADGVRDALVERHRGRLFGRALLVSGLTLVSRVLGFVREVLSAALFGDVSGIYDAFLTAWRVPNLFRRLLGEGAISTSFQTTLTEVDGDLGEAAGRRLFLRTLRLMLAVLTAICAIASGLALIVPDAWLGADPGAVRELVLRLLPFVILVCLAALAGGALQVRGHFAVPALAPTALNIVWIGVLALVGAHFGWRALADPLAEDARQLEMVRVLAFGVLAAGALQLAVHVPALAAHGFLRRRPGGSAGTGATVSEPRAIDVLRTSLPLAFGAAVYQVNVMVDGFMAEALLRDGGPSAYYFATRVSQFPLGLIAVAAMSAVFPALMALGHRGERAELRRLHDEAQLGVLFLAAPASAGLCLLAGPICAALFHHGEYGWEGIARMASTLRMLALALVPAGAVGLVSRAYYALGDYKTPVRVSVAMLLLNPILNFAFVRGAGMDADGLALGTVLCSFGNLLLLWPGLSRRLSLPASERRAWWRALRIALASAASGAAALLAHRLAAPAAAEGLPAGSGPALLAAAAAGITVHALAARILGLPEWEALRARVRSRGGRAPGGPWRIQGR